MLKRLIKRVFSLKDKNTFHSAKYWEERYKSGGNSGEGSYDKYAIFKAEVINKFLVENNIKRVIEFGCGDGNQLSLINYSEYIGLDVSETIIKNCIERFKNDTNKSFFLYKSSVFSDKIGIFKCEVSLSLDVLYHLIEDDVYFQYLQHLFSTANKFVVIYSSNVYVPQRSHEYHREFLKDVEALFQNTWELIEKIENKYPAKNIDDLSGSLANFYFFKKKLNK